MLTLILGTDSARPKERTEALAGYERSETIALTVSTQELLSMAQSQSLFGGVHVYTASGFFADDAHEDELKNMLPALAASAHLFLFEEESGAALAKAVEKAGGTVVKAKAEAKKEASDPFALANALGKRDRKNLWLLYRKAIDEGASPEQLVGMLAWKARSMLAKEGTEEARKLSRAIVAVYHESRRGAGDMELLLERLILTL